MTQRMLVAGIGNIFLGDDGFGVAVAGRLAEADLPDWVRIGDYGIAGMHLAYDLAEGYDTTILVDAMPRGEEPGTVYVLEVQRGDSPAASSSAAENSAASSPPRDSRAVAALLDGHGMEPDVMLRMLHVIGAEAGRVLVVGCEPASVEERLGLSETVAAAVDQAVDIVLDLVRDAGTDRHTSARAERRPARGGTSTPAERRCAQGAKVQPPKEA